MSDEDNAPSEGAPSEPAATPPPAGAGAEPPAFEASPGGLIEKAAAETAAGSESSALLYGIDDVPPLGETLALGFQHYLTMFGSTVAIPLILGPALGISAKSTDMAILMATMFFVSGVTTLLQTTFGNRLPIVQGGTFSFLGPTFAICGMAVVADQGWQVRMTHVQGAVILGAIVEIVMGLTGMAGRVLKYVGPITIAPTIALIGLALFEFGAPVAGQDWWMGGLTIFLIILFSQILRQKHRAFELYPILLALLISWGVAAGLTAAGVFGAGHPSHVSLDNVRNAPWVRIPYPFQWGFPEFGLAAFVGMLAGYLASVVESIGDYFACARLAGAAPPDEKIVNRGITFEGIGCLIAGIFGTGNGTTSYSENIGAIGLTRVGSRRVVQAGALIMLLLGTIGKFGALFTTIPTPIVGGMYCALFGMIAAVGLSNLQRVNLNSSRNLFILGFAFFMGLSLPHYFKNNKVSFAPTAEAKVLPDTAKVNPDPAAMALLGITPEFTVAQAKGRRDKLKRLYVGETALEQADPAHAAALDAAVKALAKEPPPPPPTPTAKGDDEEIRKDGGALGALGVKRSAKVSEAKALRDARAAITGPSGAADGSLAVLTNTPPPPPVDRWKWLSDLINILGTNGMAIAAILALVLDNVVPGTNEERGLAVPH